MEQRIEALISDLGADDFCLQEFFATEAAFLGILMLFNLLAEFQRDTGKSCISRKPGEDWKPATPCWTAFCSTRIQLR